MLTCATCGCRFFQIVEDGETETNEERKTLIASKANKTGPYCPLCRHLEMALRYAQLRGLTLCVRHIQDAQKTAWLRLAKKKPKTYPVSAAAIPRHWDP